MKHFSTEKYNLAWFKLAECVSKKEKERALGIYRLLSHSVGDDALSIQLYADILLSFEDIESAIEKYLEAAEVYKKENKIIEAVAIYEHLVFLKPECQLYLIELCNLYLKINIQFKVVEHLDGLIKNKKVNFSNLYLFADIFQKLDSCLSVSESVRINQDILFLLICDKNTPRDILIAYLEKIADFFILQESDISKDPDNSLNSGLILNDFLNKLKLESEDFYDYILLYLE